MLPNIVKCDEDFNFNKNPQSVGAKCGKGLKIRCTYYIKMRGKSVVRGKIDNKKVGSIGKGRCRVRENLLNKK